MRYFWICWCSGVLLALGCPGGDADSPDVAPAADTLPSVDGAAEIMQAELSEEIGGEDLEVSRGDLVEAVPEVDSTCDFSDCSPFAAWSPGNTAFKEVTDDWGLTGVLGIKASVTDIDGDGWADLLVRNGGGPEDFSPEGNRSRWVLRNTGEGRFEDATESSGLFTARYAEPAAGTRPGDVVASADVDNDGDMDIFVGSAVHEIAPEQETSELMLNNGDGTFSLGPASSDARMEGHYAVPAGASFVDYDRDGFVDLWVVHNMVGGLTQPLQDQLFKGDGTGHFEDVTLAAGLESEPWLFPPDGLNAGLGHTWAWSSAACDLNADGVPELLAASYGRCPNHLWQGTRFEDGTTMYANRSVDSGYAYDHRMDWTDNESARCFCKLHPDAEDCDGVPPPAYMVCVTEDDIFRWSHDSDREPWRLAGNSAATQCIDVDNDGHVDLMTGEIVHWDVGSSSDPAELLFNTGEHDVKFDRPGNEITGLVREYPGPVWDNGDMTGVVFDFDNDGWADVYIGSSDYPYTKGLLFHQDSPRKFSLLKTEEYFEHLRSHGVAVADFDRDGDLDILVGHSRHRCGGQFLNDCYETQQIRLFENITSNGGTNWLQFRLEGIDGTNRGAVGARVRVTACGISQLRDVDGGHGHFGAQRDRVLHFGLGAACRADVEIRWPDEQLTVQSFAVDGGRRLFVKQGEVPVEDVP